MRSPCSALILVPVLLGASPAWAQAPTCQAGAPHLELTSEAVPPAEICIRPGQFLPLFFDTPLASGTVVLEGREHFRRVEVSPQAVLLEPSEGLPPGARLQLEVRFADGQVPQSARFTLVAHPEQAARKVEVTRVKPAASPCPEDSSALSTMPLSQAVALGVLTESGVSAHLFPAEQLTQSSQGALQAQRLTFYRARYSLALEVLVRNEDAGREWLLAGAVLQGPNGELLPARAVHSDTALKPGKVGRLYVEWTVPAPDAPKSYTLQLWDAGKARTVTVRSLKLP